MSMLDVRPVKPPMLAPLTEPASPELDTIAGLLVAICLGLKNEEVLVVKLK